MRIRWNVRNPDLKRVAPIAMRLGSVALALGLAGALIVWGIDLGNRIGGVSGVKPGPDLKQQVLALETELTRLGLERDQLAASLDSAAKTHEQQTGRIKALEIEGGKLIDDLASFASQLPPAKGIAIRRFDADRPEPNQLHYRLLLTRGAKNVAPESVGQLQMAVIMEKAGKAVVLTVPEGAAVDDARYAIKLDKLQRLDGMLQLPDGAKVKSVEVRILEKGQVRTVQALTLKDAVGQP